MPPAAIPAITAGIGAAGLGSSAVGGKKASGRANDIAQQQVNLQRQLFGTLQQQYGLGRSAFTPALNYWTTLLGGNPVAVNQAVGPFASDIGQAAQGARTSITATTPRGGEQNLAVANTYNTAANNMARLYAGVQPLAATNLASLSGTAFGSGAALNPGANIGAALSGLTAQQGFAQQAGQGFGSLLYSANQKKQQQKANGGKQSPINVPSSITYGQLPNPIGDIPIGTSPFPNLFPGGH